MVEVYIFFVFFSCFKTSTIRVFADGCGTSCFFEVNSTVICSAEFWQTTGGNVELSLLTFGYPRVEKVYLVFRLLFLLT